MSDLFKDLDTDEPNWKALHDSVWTDTGMLVFGATLPKIVTRAKGKLIYLATPYSKLVVDAEGVWSEFKSDLNGSVAVGWQSELAGHGLTSISPIAASMAICEMASADYDLDQLDAEFWERWCFPLLARSEALVIPPIDGWDESVGVWREAVYFLKHCRPVFVMKPVRTDK